MKGIREWNFTDQGLVKVLFLYLGAVDAHAAGRVALRIAVDKERLFSAAARDAARLIAVVVLPTPPFWLAIANIFFSYFSGC